MRLVSTLIIGSVLSACSGPDRASVTLNSELSGASLNDVSVLWPLTAEGLDAVPGLGIGGEAMLTSAQSDRLPALVDTVFETLKVKDVASELKVVGIRFDPCFTDVPGVGACRPQMRLVVQAVRNDHGTIVIRDTAVHLFYELSRAEVTATVASLVAARRPSDASALEPLSINPTLLKQGSNGAYGQALKAALGSFAKAKKLSRVAFTAVQGRGNSWKFGAFDVSGEDQKAVAIPGAAGAEVITFSLGVRPINGF